MSAYGYDSSPDRYSDGEWQRTKQETLDAHTCEPSPQRAEPGHSPSTLVPGIVKMSLRGTTNDVEQVVSAMRAIGIVVWRANSPGTTTGNRAGYSYVTVEVPGDRDG